jgi:diadenosine tetraphosphate (Ap4A) HIT family hydrolase
MSNCIFCKIIKGAIPSLKVAETELSYAFLDISPLSRKHVVCVPPALSSLSHTIKRAKLHIARCPQRYIGWLRDYKVSSPTRSAAHGRYIEDIPDENLAEIGPLIKKIAKAIGASDYNVLQNNGAKAMQVIVFVWICTLHDKT